MASLSRRTLTRLYQEQAAREKLKRQVKDIYPAKNTTNNNNNNFETSDTFLSQQETSDDEISAAIESDLKDVFDSEKQFDWKTLNIEEVENQFQYEVDSTILRSHAEFKRSGFEQLFDIDGNYKCGLKLLLMLRKAKCSLDMFDKIVDWAISSTINYGVKFDASLKLKREDVLKKIAMRYNMHGLNPMVTPYTLLASNIEVGVVHFHWNDVFYSLVSDEILNRRENLLESNPPFNGIYGDVNTGEAHREAHQLYIEDPIKEALEEAILFSDKTHTDINGRLCLEPLMVTLARYKEEVRRSPKAWRTLGFVTTHLNLGSDTSLKAQDYHNIMDIILKPLKDAQIVPPLWIYGNNIKSVWSPVLFIMCDNDGADGFCGRYKARGKIPYLCRECNIHTDNIDDPFWKKGIKLTMFSDVQKMYVKNQKDKMNSLSMHFIKNAFHDLKFSYREGGVNQSSPAESLHTIDQGWHTYTCIGLFGLKKQKKGKKVTGSDPNNFIPDDLQVSRNKVFSGEYRVKFEKLCKQYGKHLSRQSDRNKPRTLFNTSYTRVTRKNGHEMGGLLLVYLMIFVSDEDKVIDKLFHSDRSSAFIHIIELSLMLGEFVKTKKHRHSDVNLFDRGLPLLMNSYATTLHRTEGKGMKFQKFHMPKHFKKNIRKFGSMENFNSMIGEMLHKTETKEPAQNTQRRKEKFEIQTTKQYVNNLKLLRAMDDFNTDDKVVNERNKNCKNNIRLRKKLLYSDHDNCIKKQRIRSRKWPQLLLLTKCSILNY